VKFLNAIIGFIQRKTVSLTALIMAVLNLGQLMTWWKLTVDQLAGFNVAIGAFFALFVAQTVTANARINGGKVFGGFNGKTPVDPPVDPPAEDPPVDPPV